MTYGPAEVLAELEASELAWIEILEQHRRASNRRIRAVNDAKDAGLSNREIAEALQAPNDKLKTGRTIRRGDISHFIACGYPEDDGVQEAS